MVQFDLSGEEVICVVVSAMWVNVSRHIGSGNLPFHFVVTIGSRTSDYTIRRRSLAVDVLPDASLSVAEQSLMAVSPIRSALRTAWRPDPC